MSSTKLQRSAITPKNYAQEPTGRVQLFNQTYIGFVKEVADEKYMGRLRVYIPELGGDPSPEGRNTWHTVSYCSPFAGATSIDVVQGGANNMDNGTGVNGQNSYGMWFVPPDLDNEVVCMFINGDPQRGIWFGCLYQQNMNHMVPGIPNNKSFEKGCGDTDPPVIEYNKKRDQKGKIGGLDGLSASVAEVGKKAKDLLNNGSDKKAEGSEPLRSIFEPLHRGLYAQGLYSDPVRGPSDAGARRKGQVGPGGKGGVYGIKTPKGQHLVMDDNEENEYIRFRTKGGTQILVHETSGFIYLNTKNGNSWLEISDEGIDIYSTASISMRTHKNFNMHADGDFNLHVSGDMTTFVGKSNYLSVKEDMQVLNGKSFYHDTGEDYNLTVNGTRKTLAQKGDNITSMGYLAVGASEEIGVTSGANIKMQGSNIKLNSGTAKQPDPAQPAQARKPQDKTDREMQPCEYKSTKSQTVVARLVTHEPFDRKAAEQEEKQPHVTEKISPDPQDINFAPDTEETVGGNGGSGSGNGTQNTDTTGNDSTNTGGKKYDLPDVKVNGTKVPEDVHDAIIKASEKYGVPYGDMMAMAYEESKFKNNDTSSAGAKGVFQFIPRTAKAYGILGKETDPYANADAAARLYLDNKKMLQANGIPNPTATDIYVLHNVGPRGIGIIKAAQTNPDALVTKYIPQSFADSNPMWYKNGGSKGTTLTVAESYQRLQRINAESNAYTSARKTS